jgi:hypothetical protein
VVVDLRGHQQKTPGHARKGNVLIFAMRAASTKAKQHQNILFVGLVEIPTVYASL